MKILDTNRVLPYLDNEGVHMQPSKWEVWPWNWRKVRKAKISEPDRHLFERYGEAVIGSILAGASCPTAPELQAIIPGNICLPPNTGKCTEARDWLTECRDADIRREQRLETIEIGVVALITVEIGLSILFGAIGIYEASIQGKVLDHMDTSTAATATLLENLARDQAATLKILQDQQTEREKKPKLALYVGDIPIDRATVRLEPQPQSTADCAHLALFLINTGAAPAAAPRLHVVTPESVSLDAEAAPLTYEHGAPFAPKTQRWTLQLPQLPVGETTIIQARVCTQRSHPAFKVVFTLDAPELQAVVLLGSLTVLPPKP